MKRLPQHLLRFSLITLALFLCAKSMAADEPSGLKITATIPAHTVIHGGAAFKATLLVENPTTKLIRFKTTGCSWFENWKTDNASFGHGSWACFWNPWLTIEIQPGGSFTDEFDVSTDSKITSGKVAFRFGLTSSGAKETWWSNKVEIQIDPKAPKPVESMVQDAGGEEGKRTLGKGCKEVYGSRSTG